MKNIFKKNTSINIFIDSEKLINSIVYEKNSDVDFCKLTDLEKEKILENILNQNKEKINIRVKIKNQYFLIGKFFQLISKLSVFLNK